MKNRIRYEPTKVPHTLLSVRIFSVQKKKVRIQLNTENKSFAIIDISTGDTLTSGQCISLQMLKINAKQALTDMGFRFYKESRQ